MAWFCPTCGTHWLPGPVRVNEAKEAAGKFPFEQDPEVKDCPKCRPSVKQEFDEPVRDPCPGRNEETTSLKTADRAGPGGSPPGGV